MEDQFEAVLDMSVGQVVDALLSGDEFYVYSSGKYFKVSIGSDTCYISSKRGGIGNVSLRFDNLKETVRLGLLQRKVNWTDNLDGTWGNGVWCLYGDDYTKVLGSNHNTLIYEIRELCTPVPKELAELLEKNYQIEMEK